MWTSSMFHDLTTITERDKHEITHVHQQRCV